MRAHTHTYTVVRELSWSSLVAQQFKDPVLSLQWFGSLLRHGFNPWPGISTRCGWSPPHPPFIWSTVSTVLRLKNHDLTSEVTYYFCHMLLLYIDNCWCSMEGNKLRVWILGGRSHWQLSLATSTLQWLLFIISNRRKNWSSCRGSVANESN